MDDGGEKEQQNRLIKQLNRVVCICKGIKLARILPHLDGAETVADVNEAAGTGCGGLQW